MTVSDRVALRNRARARMARERLNRIEEMRDVAALSATGLPQRAIAEAVGTTQPRVGRILKTLERRGLIAQGYVPVTPEEIILRTTVEHGDRDEMVQMLCDFTYTFGEHAPYPAEGATSGTWDQVAVARVEGWLSEGEFKEISDRARH